MSGGMAKCGCIYATAQNTPTVRAGYEMGGYLKEPCPEHSPPLLLPRDPYEVQRELIAAAQDYMSQIGQGYEAHGLPFGPSQQESDARLRAALTAALAASGGDGKASP